MPPDRKVLLTPSPSPRTSRQIVRTRVTQDDFNRATHLHEDFTLSRRGGNVMFCGHDSPSSHYFF